MKNHNQSVQTKQINTIIFGIMYYTAYFYAHTWQILLLHVLYVATKFKG